MLTSQEAPDIKNQTSVFKDQNSERVDKDTPDECDPITRCVIDMT